MAAVDGDPVSSFVFETLIAGLRTIRKKNGYHTDLGKWVTEEDENIATYNGIILDEELEEPAEDSAVGAYDLTSYVKIWFSMKASGADARPAARNARADIMKYMHSGIYVSTPIGGGQMKNLPLRVEYRQSAMNGGGIVDSRAYGWVLFAVTHTVARTDPAIGKPV